MSAARHRALAVALNQPCPRWRRELPGAARLSVAAARAAVAGAGRPLRAPAELSIVLGDDALLRRLNRLWRGQDKPTNVLSFPGEEKPPRAADAPLLLGDVVLAFETVLREAEEQRKRPTDHLRHLVVHGVLHLLGYDHVRVAEARRMEALERAVLGRLGVADPYRLSEASHG
ncbi:MAG TPA: rRNA maturation RNase YbeY [Stellaceae bacterium]|nr:rRNA maturation RNase YbeY [Stellaceae bacterium]